MNVTAACYLPDGTITKLLRMNEESIPLNMEVGEEALNVPDWVQPDKHYILNGAVVAKAPFPPMDIGNGTVYGIPTGTMVMWPDGEKTVENDGFIEATSNASTEFYFTLEHPEYITERIVVPYDVQ